MRSFNILLISFFLSTSIFAQSVNEYKYIVVPNQFEFLNGADQYQLNSLTVFLFKKYGFDAYKDGLETPASVYENRCDALYADVLDDSGFLRTKLTVVLKDCRDNVIYISDQGGSKEKEYKKSYHNALREAFSSIEELNYSYTPKEKVNDVNVDKVAESEETNIKQEEGKTKESDGNMIKETETPEVNQGYIEQIAADEKLVVEKKGQVFVSKNSSYKLVEAGGSYIIFDGAKEIGSAQLEKANTYIVKTIDFSGRGRISGNEFLIDREIKGVGIVTMRFEKVN